MSHPSVLGSGFPTEPGLESTFLGERLGSNTINVPSMFNMSGFRNPLMQQIPAKTVNEITYPPARISNIPVDSGFNTYMFGRGDVVPKSERLFHDPYFNLNNRVLLPAPTFIF